MRTLKIARTALALVTAAVLGWSGAQAQTSAPKRGGTLTVGFVSDSKTLDPIFSVQYTERQVLYLVFDTLVKYEPDFSIKPELAESWALENDGKRVVFKLKSGVKFHDGTAFDASVVKWNIDQRLDPAVASPQRGQLEPVIASVDVVDPTTVAFNLKTKYAGLMSLLGERPGFMVSPTAWKKAGKEFGGQPVGTGAFVFKEWVRGNRITLERNPNYWQPGLPYLDKIVFSDLAGSVVGIQRLQTGEIDYVADLGPQDIRVLEGKPGIALNPITVGRWYSLQWHMDAPPFNNPKLRQAIAHAIDRNRINEIVMRGKGTVSNGATPEGLWWYDAGIKSPEFSVEKAKAALKEAGYPNGFEYALSTPQVAALQQVNQLVQEQLAAAGIKITLEPASSAEWYDRMVKGLTNFTPTRWTQRPDPDGLLYLLFHSKGYGNTTHYKNARVDELLDKAREIYEIDQRKKLYSEAQKIIAADLPMLPLFFSAEYAALRDDVKNHVWIPDQIPRFREVWKAGK
jgi:peptide/nickel transport system substrate-binding protein